MREPTREEWASWAAAIEPPKKPTFWMLIAQLAGMTPDQTRLAELQRQSQLNAYQSIGMFTLHGMGGVLGGVLGGLASGFRGLYRKSPD
jgi:hypothetical protein